MTQLTRRQFGALSLAAATQAPRLFGATSIDDVLRDGIKAHGIPCVTAVVGSVDKILYQGAFGVREAGGPAVKIDSIFSIASMTKAVASAAAMQLVDQGKATLDEPVSKHLPQLANLQVVSGYDAAGKAILKPASRPVTLRLLMSHTSGFAYDTWDENMFRYGQQVKFPAVDRDGPVTPLSFEPGARWQYGTGVDWTGRLVEKISGMTLDAYLQKNIVGPLGMTDTTFIFPASKYDRLVTAYRKQSDGSLKPDTRMGPPPAPAFHNGGGGLYSTAGDYLKFTQMILRKGKSADGKQILSAKAVAEMSKNQTGTHQAGVLKTKSPAVSADVDLHPGASDRYGLGFLINPEPYKGGRAAGSLAWAGIYNTFYWIDPKKNRAAVIMMQFLPFVDPKAVALLGDFERAVYSNLA